MSAKGRGMGIVACGLLLATLALPAQAQNLSSRWLPFIGCWEPFGVEGETGLLCFEVSGDGVQMSNVFEGEVTATERLVADGVARAVTAEGCAGTESVEFSDDGRRVFTESSFNCESGETRTGTGVLSFISPTQWIDVRSLTVEGEPVAWVQRYSAATAESLRDHGVEDPAASDRAGIRARRQTAAADIDIGDVEEALERVDPQAVKIWVATHDTELGIEAEDLVRLAEAGVPDDVIDVMVAVSFPDRFAVTPEGVPQGVRDRVVDNAYRTGARIGFRSYLWDPLYYGSRGYYRYGYRYSPFGYYGYGGYYGYVQASIIVVPRDDDVAPSGGRIERGRGYRGPRSSGGTAVPSPSSSRGGGSAAPSSRGGDDRPSGSSSGGGRRAVRR